MNYPILFRLLSIICLVLALGFSVSLTVGFFLDAGAVREKVIFGFSIAILVSMALGGTLRYISRKAEKKIFLKEALATVGLGWLLASLLGTIPYLLISTDLSWGDAFFEATSGITTTGASTKVNLEEVPRGLMFWRQMSQWMGGLGVVVFFVALLGSLGVGGKALFANESTGNPGDMDFSRMQEGAQGILWLYLGLSITCTLGFMLAGMDWFDAVGHMFTTVSTSGFSTRSESLAAFSAGAEWVCVIFMILGGTSFVFLMALFRGRFQRCARNTEVKVYYVILLAATAYIALWLSVSPVAEASLHDTIRTAAFQVVSISTTSGFSTRDFNTWPTPALAVLILLMVIGGCSGSTAGGSKVIRWVVLSRIFHQEVQKAFRPNVIRPLNVNGKPLDREGREEVLHFLVLTVLIFAGSFLIVSALEPQLDPFSALMAVIACLFNIGPGLGAVGPMENFSFLNEPTKIYLALLMILGRLEFFAVLVLFLPSLWRKF
jgi:trk system potassium uptake protein TrkH